MARELTWLERLDSLSAAVRIAVKDECRKEQIEMLKKGNSDAADAIERVALSLVARFPAMDD